MAAVTFPTSPTAGDLYTVAGRTWKYSGAVWDMLSESIPTWTLKTGTYTAVSGDRIQADTTTGAFTITLPSSPATNASVIICDPLGTWSTNNLTVARNGATIRTLSENLVCDSASKLVELIYTGATWSVFITAAASILNTDMTGASIQHLEATNATYSALTTVLPLDDTVPAATEGTQVLSQSITLGAVTNKVAVEVSLPLIALAAAGGWVIVALFRNSVCINVGALCLAGANYGAPISISCTDTPAEASATYSVRIGPAVTGTAYINGTAGMRFFGGATVAVLTLTEIKT